MELYELIYVSTATGDMSPAELATLLDEVRHKNAQRNITGLLVYHHHEFMQLLEGDKAEIFSLYQKVAEDKRHQRVTLMWSGAIAERAFGSWQMAFLGLDDMAIEKAAGYSDFLKNEFTAQVLRDTPSIGKDFLLSLRNDFLRNPG
jgi:hypothetical protein